MPAQTTSRLLGAALLSICVSANALAQTSDPLASPGQTASIAPPGQLTIERVEQGFVFAPDARVTEVNGETATLAGGYVGWMTDRTWLVGAGGYWLANQDDDLKMTYGGMVVEYLARSQQRIGFGVARVGRRWARHARQYCRRVFRRRRRHRTFRWRSAS